MERETSTQKMARNAKQATVEWHFTIEDARNKLKKLYPVIRMDENVNDLYPSKQDSPDY